MVWNETQDWKAIYLRIVLCRGEKRRAETKREEKGQSNFVSCPASHSSDPSNYDQKSYSSHLRYMIGEILGRGSGSTGWGYLDLWRFGEGSLRQTWCGGWEKKMRVEMLWGYELLRLEGECGGGMLERYTVEEAMEMRLARR
jgi:hypothetical protein